MVWFRSAQSIENGDRKVYKTYYPKASEINREWFVVDADGKNLGRLAASIAHVLLGKHKPTFTSRIVAMSFCEPRSW